MSTLTVLAICCLVGLIPVFLSVGVELLIVLFAALASIVGAMFEIGVAVACGIGYLFAYLLEAILGFLSIIPMVLHETTREWEAKTWHGVFGVSILGLITLFAYLWRG